MSAEAGPRVLKPIVDMVSERPNEDRTSQFEALWGVLDEMHAKISQRFELQRDPCCEDLIDYQMARRKHFEDQKKDLGATESASGAESGH